MKRLLAILLLAAVTAAAAACNETIPGSPDVSLPPIESPGATLEPSSPSASP